MCSPQEVIGALPEEIVRFEPDTPIRQCTKKGFIRSGRLYMRIFEVFVEEVDLMELLFAATTSLAQTQVPLVISQAFGCQVDCLVQNRWRSEGHRNKNHTPEIGRTGIGQAVCERV